MKKHTIIIQDITNYTITDKVAGYNPASVHEFDGFSACMRFLRDDFDITEEELDRLMDHNVFHKPGDEAGLIFTYIHRPR